MSFGYTPGRGIVTDFILKIIGEPSLIRRMQAPVIMSLLDLRETDRVLDAGCGGGIFTYEIAKTCECTGIDWILKKNARIMMDQSPRSVFIRSDIHGLPVKSGSFDKILLSSVLQLAADDGAILEECNRALKSDGVMVLSVPIDYVYVNKLNRIKPYLMERFKAKGKGFYDREEVIGLLKRHGFEVLQVEYSPGRLGSLLYEVWAYLSYCLGLTRLSGIYFMIVYPVAYFDRYDQSVIGDELIIKVKKCT
jgi:SAM-dependent methyltransferase